MPSRGFRLCAAAALLGCSHEAPFETAPTGSDAPFLPGVPVRLTYNPGKDIDPAWTADGSTLIYAWEQLGQDNRDRCLGELPATGGSRLQMICDPAVDDPDSLDVFDTPSPSPDGRLVYTRSTSPPAYPVIADGQILLAPLADPLATTVLGPLPYTIPGGRRHAWISTPRWASATRLYFVGQSVAYSSEDRGLPFDTLVTGLELVEVDLSGAQPSFSVVPGSYGASSAALNDGRDTLYYTLNNDSRVYRRALGNGAVSVAHDFGGGIARDVTVRGNRLVAVVGGEILFVDDATLGPYQADGGGNLVSVNLDTGQEAILPTDTPLLFRHPEFAPAGEPIRLAAEGVPPTPDPGPLFRYQYVHKLGDLYLFEAP